MQLESIGRAISTDCAKELHAQHRAHKTDAGNTDASENRSAIHIAHPKTKVDEKTLCTESADKTLKIQDGTRSYRADGEMSEQA